MKPGDWICPTCDKLIYARWDSCRDCSTRRPADQPRWADSDEEGAGDEHSNGPDSPIDKERYPDARPGDWICPSCKELVFARRDTCRDCRVRRPTNQPRWEPRDEEPEVDLDKFPNWKPGDWICRTCDKLIFARNDTCRDCRSWRPSHQDSGISRDLDRTIKKGIAWINGQGIFDNEIFYQEVAKAAVGSSEHYVTKVFDNLLDAAKGGDIENPTGWICKAFTRSKPNRGSEWIDGSLEKTLRKGIAWLNSPERFDNAIRFDDVMDAAAGLPEDQVTEIFDNLLHSSYEHDIQNPTGWICKALNSGKPTRGNKWTDEWPTRGSKWNDEKPTRGSKWIDENLEKTLRKGIGWLNAPERFDNKIRYNDVAEAAAGMPKDEVIEVFDRLVNVAKEEDVDNPTGWICKGLSGRRRWASKFWSE